MRLRKLPGMCRLDWFVLPLLLAAGPASAGSVVADVTHDGQRVKHAVVSATPLGDVRLPRPAHPGGVMDQRDKEFRPHVLSVLKGTVVRFPNSDDVRHQIYSFSETKTFERSLYAGTRAEPVTFDRTGVVNLGCNIHDWMLGFIYVLDTPAFDRTGEDGRAVLRELPAGRYRVRVWHPLLRGDGPAARTVELTADHGARLDYALDLENPPARPQRGFGTQPSAAERGLIEHY